MSKDYSKYVEFKKAQHQKDIDFFFGQGNFRKSSNKYDCFNGFIDNDNIVIITNNVKVLKGNYVLLVDNNKAVYLKEWQVRCGFSKQIQESVFVIKLNRNFFKPYTFNFTFSDFSFEKEDSFDELLAVARTQAWKNEIAF